MDENQIFQYLRRYRNYLGTYPRDRLGPRLSVNQGLIINTDTASGPGEHWVAIYMGEKAIYFDSFGLPPLHQEIIDYLDRISPIGWFHNTIDFQSIYQDTCGLHSIYFLCCMFDSQDFGQFTQVFSHSTHINDILAGMLYKMDRSRREYTIT